MLYLIFITLPAVMLLMPIITVIAAVQAITEKD